MIKNNNYKKTILMTLLIAPLFTAGIAVGGIQNSYASTNPPTADPNGPYFGEVNIPVSFDGTDSFDPDGETITFAWTFGDTNSDTGDTPTHTYTTAGTFDVCLTVTDESGDTDRVCTDALISPPAFTIQDDEFGGDCEPEDIGKWNEKNKTCRLTVDLDGGERIIIGDEDITLDCKNHLLDGNGFGGTGIYIGGQSFVTIKNCNVTEYEVGILLNGADENTLKSNNAFENDFGIFLDGSNGNTLKANDASNNGSGIILEFSDNNTLIGNTANENDELAEDFGSGISLEESDFNTLIGNTANENEDGIELEESDFNDLTGNTTNENKGDGIGVEQSDDNTLIGNTANDNDENGIELDESHENTLKGNTANGNGVDFGHGIHLDSSRDNVLHGNTANDNGDKGIRLDDSHNNNLLGNTLNFNRDGIKMLGSDFNTLIDNTAFQNTNIGFRILSSVDNTLEENLADDNAVLGFQDNTSDTGTAGTANDYTDNTCVDNGSFLDDGSTPDGLCTPQD